MQSKTGSIIESLVNVAVGYLVALIAQIVIFPVFGIQVPFSTQNKIVILFTVISIVRSYLLRRTFNRYIVWKSHKRFSGTSLAEQNSNLKHINLNANQKVTHNVI